MKQQQISLGELALELGVNKSMLAYYYSMGLLNPVAKIGRMNVFDREKTIKAIENIQSQKEKGKTLDEIKGSKK